MNESNTDSLLRIEQVLKLVPISRSAWYKGIRLGLYPKPIKLGSRIAFWRSSAIEALVATLGGR